MWHTDAMPTGTQTPPTSDLIERFNSIIMELMACVAAASLKAAGVPWPVRMILAPLLRRRLARWSAEFSRIVTDARSGRGIAPPGHLECGGRLLDHAARTIDGGGRNRSASGGASRAGAPRPRVERPDLVANFQRPGARINRGGLTRPYVRTSARAHGAGRRGQWAAHQEFPHGGAVHRGPAIFSATRAVHLCTTISLRLVNGLDPWADGA
jgi:hypothetical protein